MGRKIKLPILKVRGMKKALSCLDDQFQIIREKFEASLALEMSHNQHIGQPFSRRKLNGVLQWLTLIANQNSYRFYLHLHDNIVGELAMFDYYDGKAFAKDLLLFQTHSAEEGGTNVLGVLDLKRDWVFAMEVDHQGRFTIEFSGRTEQCQSLLSSFLEFRNA